jgi:uncharacterized protein (TIGR02271 family)
MRRPDRVHIPLAEERLRVGRKRVATRRVRLRTRTERTQHVIEEPSLHETFDIKRIKTNQLVDSPPRVRQEGRTTIIPLLKEVIIVTKQLVVAEELHITRHVEKSSSRKRVTLRSQRLEIDDGQSALKSRVHRHDSHGNGRHQKSIRRRKQGKPTQE